MARVNELLQFLKPAVDSDAWDRILFEIIHRTRESSADSKAVDQFIQLLQDDSHKVDALIECGRLKNAYLLAVKTTNAISFVRRIQEASMSAENGHVIAALCASFLNDHGG
jgi:hypothetical protein